PEIVGPDLLMLLETDYAHEGWQRIRVRWWRAVARVGGACIAADGRVRADAGGEALEAVRGDSSAEHILKRPIVAPELDGVGPDHGRLIPEHEGALSEKREDDRSS